MITYYIFLCRKYIIMLYRYLPNRRNRRKGDKRFYREPFPLKNLFDFLKTKNKTIGYE